jgi:hypothetical protein
MTDSGHGFAPRPVSAETREPLAARRVTVYRRSLAPVTVAPAGRRTLNRTSVRVTGDPSIFRYDEPCDLSAPVDPTLVSAVAV